MEESVVVNVVAGSRVKTSRSLLQLCPTAERPRDAAAADAAAVVGDVAIETSITPLQGAWLCINRDDLLIAETAKF